MENAGSEAASARGGTKRREDAALDESGRGERAHAEIRFVPLGSTRDCSARHATGDEELEQMDGRWRRSRTDWTVLRVMTNVG